MNRIQRATLNMVTGAIGYVLPMIISIITTPLLIQIIGDTGYGLQNLMNVVIGYFLITEMGVDLSIIRYVSADLAANNFQKTARFVGDAFKLYLSVGIVSLIALVAAARFIATHFFSVPPDEVGNATLVFALTGVAVFGTMLVYWGRAVMIGIQRMDLSNMNTVITNLLGVVGGLVVAWLGYGVVGYVACRALALVISGFIYIGHVHRHLGRFPFHRGFDRENIRRMGGYARFGVINRTSGILTAGLDRTLIGAWWGVATVTLYAVPWMLASSMMYMLNNIVMFVFPMASELQSTNRQQEFTNLYLQASRFIAAITTLVTLPLLVFGDSFLVLWLGPELGRQSSLVFRLLLIGTYLSIVLMLINNQVLPGTGQIRLQTTASVSRAALLVIGLLLLVRPFGPAGAAGAVVLAAVSDILFSFYITIRIINIPIHQFLTRIHLPVLLTAIAVGAGGYFLRPLAVTWFGLAGVVSVVMLLYLGIGFFVGVFGALECKALREVWRMVNRIARPAHGKG